MVDLRHLQYCVSKVETIWSGVDPPEVPLGESFDFPVAEYCLDFFSAHRHCLPLHDTYPIARINSELHCRVVVSFSEAIRGYSTSAWIRFSWRRSLSRKEREVGLWKEYDYSSLFANSNNMNWIVYIYISTMWQLRSTWKLANQVYGIKKGRLILIDWLNIKWGRSWGLKYPWTYRITEVHECWISWCLMIT
jgi:hypothetical protein